MLKEGAAASEIALALAEKKACQVSSLRSKDTVIGGDQILGFNDELIGKCGSLREVRQLLLRLRGRSHSLFGGLVIARAGVPKWRHQSRCDLRMREFSEQFLKSYLESEGETLLSSVGGYRLEGEGVQLFDTVEGSYFAVLGLDLLPLLAALRALDAVAP